MTTKIKTPSLKLLLLLISIILLLSTIYIEHFSKPSGNYHDIQIPNFEYYNIIDQKYYKFSTLFKSNNTNPKTIIHFWATWCGICKSEFNDIIGFAKKNKDTNILAISIDINPEDTKTFINTLNNYDKNKLPNLVFAWDQSSMIALNIFGTMAVPENFMVNSNFEVIDKVTGKLDWNNYS